MRFAAHVCCRKWICENSSDLRERAERVLGYTFQDPDLLNESLTHASIADNRLDSNERMEFLGDAVLDLIICEALYRALPQSSEGDLTKIKSAVVSRRTCAEVSNETGLTDLLDHRQGDQLARDQMPSLAGGGGVRIDRRGRSTSTAASTSSRSTSCATMTAQDR